MRLATFNLLHGRSLTDGLVDSDRLAAAVAALDADVLALQEVDRDQTPQRQPRPHRHRRPRPRRPRPPLRRRRRRHPRRTVPPPAPRRRRPRRTLLRHRPDQPPPRPQLADHPTQPAPYARRSTSPGPGGGLHPAARRTPRRARRRPRHPPRPPHRRRHPPVLRPRLERPPTAPAVRALRALPAPRVLLGDLNLPAGAARAAHRLATPGPPPHLPRRAPRVQLDHILADRHGLDRLPPVPPSPPPRPPSPTTGPSWSTSAEHHRPTGRIAALARVQGRLGFLKTGASPCPDTAPC